jgi:hypothetical protein
MNETLARWYIVLVDSMIVLLSAYLLRVLGHVGLIIHDDDDLTLGLSQTAHIPLWRAHRDRWRTSTPFALRTHEYSGP